MDNNKKNEEISYKISILSTIALIMILLEKIVIISFNLANKELIALGCGMLLGVVCIIVMKIKMTIKTNIVLEYSPIASLVFVLIEPCFTLNLVGINRWIAVIVYGAMLVSFIYLAVSQNK